jgi:signal transduction histidine kinase
MGVLTVLATVGPFVYIYINRKAENRLMREQRQYQNTLRQASSGMIRIRDLRKLLNLIVHVVTKTVKIEFASIFLLDTQNNRYSLAAIRDSSSMPEDFSLEPNSTIIEQLFNKRETLVYEEIQLQAQDSPKDLKLNSLEQQLRQLQAAVVIPSFVSNKLLGFLVLGKKLSGKVYSQDDLNVFSVLANQMALAVENTSSFEELKNTRNQLVQLEKLAATGKLAHQVAHEIKNPLTAIKTFTDYLDEKYQSQEFRQKFKKIVGSEIDRLQDVVLQLMDVSKANTPRFKERVDVHQIIEATVLLLENQLLDAGIHIECKLNAQNPILKADPDQLKQVFLNLILNAKDAMPSGGTLTITTQVQRTENRSQKIESNLRSSVDYQSVIICVSDTGCGIPETDLPHIFEQFFTTKEKGSGLGLSIVQGIILAHNGKITCQSQVDKGTTFLIELPVS